MQIEAGDNNLSKPGNFFLRYNFFAIYACPWITFVIKKAVEISLFQLSHFYCLYLIFMVEFLQIFPINSSIIIKIIIIIFNMGPCLKAHLEIRPTN